MREPYFHIDGFDSRMLGRVSTKVLFGRMACASAIKVADKDVDFYSDDYIPAVKLCAEYGGWSSARSNLIIRTDEWGGCYAGYDMVTSLWPLVSPSLFDRVEERYRLGQAPLAQARYKKLYPSGNGLWGISELSSILINPDYGISRVKNSTWDNDPKIGKPGEIVDAFYLMELKNVDEEEGGGKNPIFFAVYAFVSPDPLSDEQTDDLEQYHEDRPGNEAYYQGVKEGWSVLFLGDGNYYFKAGLCPKSELIEVAKKDASLGDKVGCYRNLDGSKLFSK